MSMQNADKNPAQNIGQTPKDESQLQRMQKMGNQHAMTTGKPTNAMNWAAKVADYALLRPIIEPQLDKHRAMYLQHLYIQLRNNKEEFVRHLRSLVGDHMLNLALWTLQQGQMMKNTYKQPAQLTANPNSLPMDNNAQKPRSSKHKSDSRKVHKSSNVNAKKVKDQPISMKGLAKQRQQQHMPFPRPPVANMNMSSQSVKQQTGYFTSSLALQQNSGLWQPSMHKDQMNDQHHRYQTLVLKGPSLGQSESSKKEAFETMTSRPGFLTSMNKQEPMSVTAQLGRQSVSAGKSLMASGSNAKTPAEKPTVGQKKPLEAPISSLSKKQRVSAAFSDQKIELLNEVTSVSGVNLKEEEEQLFSGSKEDSQLSEASRDISQPSRPQEDPSLQQADQHSVHMSQATSMEDADKSPAQNTGQTPKDEFQLQRMQNMGNQQAMATGQPANVMNRPSQKVSFEPLIRVIMPQLDKDGARQLQDLYVRLQNKNKINNEEFARGLRSLVGDGMYRMAAFEVQQGQTGHNMGKTRECASRNTNTQKRHEHMQKLSDNDDFVDDDGGGEDDVDLLDPKQEQPELVENASLPSDFVEKLSSPQRGIICVEGYEVKRSCAPILEAIFKKYGDIAAKCAFKTDCLRTKVLEVVCEVVAQIQNNDFIEKMEVIETGLSDAETATIDVSWLRAHLEAINKRKEACSKKYTLLMKMKETTRLLKKAVKVDLRERRSKAVAAEQLYKKVERWMKVLHIVEKNLNANILESKAKIDSWVNHSVDGDYEDVDAVEPLDTKQEQCELAENASPMSNSLENIICVQGYKIKRRNATLLESIFKKHGDIAARCKFETESVRSSLLEAACEVVRWIQTNNAIREMKEIECRISDAEKANIDMSWLQTHMEVINKRKEATKYSLLMEMKENVILAKKVVQMDMRERCAEHVAAEQQVKKAERCVRVLHLVKENLNDNILESKAKIDSWVNHPVV